MNKELWLDLLNSDWHDHIGTGAREDRLENFTWLKKYLAPWKQELAQTPEDEIINSLKRLRRIIRQAIEAYAAGREVDPEVWDNINVYFQHTPLIRKVEITTEQPALRIVPLNADIHSFLGEIAASFAETISQSDPTRIKICLNKDCKWVFYDHSKNRSRKWCEHTCGNLIKVRNYRKRKQTATQTKTDS